MKKNILLIVISLCCTLLFSTCEPWIVPQVIFVTYDGNGSYGSMQPQRFEDGVEESLDLNQFTRSGYIFVGWNTRSDGKGKSYQDGQVVSFSESTTLYAQWGKLYTVTFKANGGSGSMSPQTFKAGQEAALKTNQFSHSGYLFSGWNTKADGSGDFYLDKEVILPTSDMTLYAQWRSPNGTHNAYDWVDMGFPSGTKWATYNVGGNSPDDYGDYYAWGEVTTDSYYDWAHYLFSIGSEYNMSKYCLEDQLLTLDKTDDAARIHWGGKWRMPTSEEIYELRMYSSWYKATYNGVDGVEAVSDINGQSIFFPASGYRSDDKLYATGSEAYYWTSSLYQDDSYYALCLGFDTESISTYYSVRHDGHAIRAVFLDKDTPSDFVKVTFNANGGSGTMAAQTFEAGVSQAIAANAFTREGYAFTGWNTKSDGSGTSYTDGQEITLTQDMTLYAQWESAGGSGGGSSISGSENGYDYVDLGLPSGLKWATCNVGATAPEGYGDYFAWGETNPKDKYNWSTYKYCNGSETSLTKYNTNSNFGTVDNKTTLDLSDDAARANWGGTWRMPTKAEQDELKNNCTWTWATQNGVNGCRVTSKTNGNSIFLPAAGYRYGTSVNNVGAYGYYWSSSLYESEPSFAYNLYFGSAGVIALLNYRYRYYGHPVRAVCP